MRVPGDISFDKIAGGEDSAHRLHRKLAVGWAPLRLKAPYDER
jgi:hypothetical protein